MKKNIFKKSLWTALMLLGSVVMTGCVAETDQEISAGGGGGSLTISIKSGDFDLPVTRAATRALTADPTATENLITTASTVIAIFDGDGNLIKAQIPELINDKLNLSGTETGTDWLSTASTVYVAANLPENITSALVALTPGTANKATFATAFSLSLADALNGNSLAGSTIPMFGAASISAGANANEYTATVNVEHMLTKVTLNSLGVDFSQSPTPNAIFQPEQVFLINVPDNIGINATGSAFIQAAPTNWYHGEVAGATNDGQNNNTGANHQVPDYATAYYTGSNNYAEHQFNANADLGTAALTAQTQMSAENPVWLSDATAGAQVAQQYFFYTMPNMNPGVDEKKTRLVIRGSFKESSSAAATEVYYAVPLANNNQTTDALSPNMNYQVDVIIKQKGATDAFAALPQDITSVLDVTYTVNNFSDEYTIVGVGGDITNTGTAKVGDYFYSDGTCSSVYDNTKTLVGLVFSTNVSSADIAAGYTHGYVMALTDAGYDYNGGNPTKTKYKYRDYTETTSGSKEDGLFNIGGSTQYSNDAGYWAAIKADLDGLDHTTTLLADANEAEYLAAHAAKDYNTTHAVTGTNSGWYLPSIGQLYALAYNFGGRTAWPALAFVNNNKGRVGECDEYHNCFFWSGADVTTASINAFLTARLVTAAGLTAGQHYQPFIDRTTQESAAYWSSSDYSAVFSLNLGFISNDILIFNVDYKTEQKYVRPVLAF